MLKVISLTRSASTGARSTTRGIDRCWERSPSLTRRVSVICLVLLAVSPVRAADGQSPPVPQNSWQKVIDATAQWQRKLADWWRRRPQAIPLNPADQRLVAVVESPALQNLYVPLLNGQAIQGRLFAANLRLTNLTRKAISIEPAQIELKADGVTLKNGVVDPRFNGQMLRMEDHAINIGKIRPSSMSLAPGFSADSWILFSGLRGGSQVPGMTLTITGVDPPLELDLNARFKEQLQLRTVRLGPRGGLALLTIGGELNCLSYPAVLEQLAQLTTERVQRAVVVWTPEAPKIPLGWLAEFVGVVQNVGREGFQSQNVQTLPGSFVELRLAELPAASRAALSQIKFNLGPTIHATKVDAVIGALRTAYEVLPRAELLEAIRVGDVMTRCAAIVSAGNRLRPEDWPLLAELIRDDEVLLRRATIHVLRNFEDQPAINELLRQARSGDPILSPAALDSLAASRFAKAHAALLELLTENDLPLRRAIVLAFARNPRSAWSQSLYELMQDIPSELGAEGLRALIRVGHSRLADALLESLKSSDAAVRQVAYLELANRSDPQSESAALAYSLEQLATLPPTPEMLTFLIRVKPPDAVPLLIKHLDQMTDDRSPLIAVLAQISDQKIAEPLADRFPKLRPAEQVEVLKVQGQHRSPRFVELAGAALQSDDLTLINTACQWLQWNPSPKGTQQLLAALDRSRKSQSLLPVASALANIASPEARRALRKARAEADHATRPLLIQLISQMDQRSPGYNAFWQAKVAVQNNTLAEAMKFYEQAIKADSELTEAYLGRANLLMKQNKFAEAGRDYEQAMKLDEFHAEAVTGVAITKVISGQCQEGLKLIEISRDKFPQDDLFHYNAACAYGRAVEAALKDDKFPDREQSLADFRRRAIDELRQSIKLGLDESNLDWMKNDPDLNSLHDLPEFQKLGKPEVRD